MEIGTVAFAGSGLKPQPSGPEMVRQERQAVKRDSAPPQAEKRVSPEEFLKKIQELTEGGQHSVSFEMDRDINMLVVKVFDSRTNEIVRQIPAESLLGTYKALQEYRRGMLVDDQS